jgi:hypothetical protein
MPGPGKVATHPESVVTGYNQSNILTNRRNRPNTSKMLPNSNVNKTPLHPHGVQAYPENHTELEEELFETAHIDYSKVAIIANPSVAALYEDALVYETGTAITATGALTAYSGAKTGRSPLDKRIVKEPQTENEVWWGPVNKPMTEDVSSIAFDSNPSPVASLLLASTLPVGFAACRPDLHIPGHWVASPKTNFLPCIPISPQPLRPSMTSMTRTVVMRSRGAPSTPPSPTEECGATSTFGPGDKSHGSQR